MNNKDRQPPKVTIIVPCYNMEHKIGRLLDSLLIQTSTEFSVLIIDDGSKDKSVDIINHYSIFFEKRGIPLTCIQQSNQGAASAVNNALSLVDTKYFCLPDADDFYSRDYIKRCLTYLEDNSRCGIVFTQCRVYYQNDLENPIGVFKRKDQFHCDNISIFKDFYMDRNVYFCPNYMIRTHSFEIANNGRDIIGGKHGQNYQMILPLVYSTQVGYLNEPLYNYIIYKNSDSHGTRTIQQRFEHIDGGYEILVNTFSRIDIPMEEREQYIMDVIQKKHILKARIAVCYGDRIAFDSEVVQILPTYMPQDLYRINRNKNYPLFFLIYSKKQQYKEYLRNCPLRFIIKSLLNKIQRN
jgi:glycosyltransferase involved in cell wall biosynthesis